MLRVCMYVCVCVFECVCERVSVGGREWEGERVCVRVCRHGKEKERSEVREEKGKERGIDLALKQVGRSREGGRGEERGGGMMGEPAGRSVVPLILQFHSVLVRLPRVYDPVLQVRETPFEGPLDLGSIWSLTLRSFAGCLEHRA